VTQREEVRTSAATRLRGAFEDVALAIHCDGAGHRGINFGDVEHRFHVAEDARRQPCEVGAGEEYRQALIELAAAAIQVAAIEARPDWGPDLNRGGLAAVIRQQVPDLDEIGRLRGVV
jgi:hypothetical protein